MLFYKHKGGERLGKRRKTWKKAQLLGFILGNEQGGIEKEAERILQKQPREEAWILQSV